MNRAPSSLAAMGWMVIYVKPGGDECPGVITRVNPDGKINIVVFDESKRDMGHAHPTFHAHIPYAVDPTGPVENTWHWPSCDDLDPSRIAGDGDVAGNIDASGDGGSASPGSEPLPVEVKPATSAEPVTAAAGASPLGAIGNLQIPEGSTLKL